ncbi:MAG: glutathione S-transferase [Hyphomicrobiales bacterium]|nr:glutathione S-transferase family protein [Hyphomicrobiales bacterium]PCJ86537.1 MAG: glutathione S-transferase [Hyphomicrobiales bacterium]
MPDIKLFGHPLSGHSYKVKLFLALTHTPHTYEIIDLMTPRPQRPAYFRDNTRYDEVPLLIIDDKPFVQSNAILLHLSKILNIFGGAPNQTQCLEWLMWEQSRLGSSLPNLRFSRKFKPDTDPAVLAWLEERLRADLNMLNTHFETSGGFVLNDAPSIADCSLAGYLYWLSDTGLDINSWPYVAAWLTRLSELDGWQHPDDLLT